MINRILYNIFYPIVLMAYCSMLLQWIEICNPESKYVQGRYLSGTKIAFGILVLIFIIMEIVTSYLQAHAGEFPIHFIVYYSFAGLILVCHFSYAHQENSWSLFLFTFILAIIFANIFDRTPMQIETSPFNSYHARFVFILVTHLNRFFYSPTDLQF